MTSAVLQLSAVCFVDPGLRALTVRKRDTSHFMLPGGKLEPEEAPLQAAVREVREELNVDVTGDDLVPLGRWTASAANEADTDIAATVYLSTTTIDAVASAEIAEIRWVSWAGRPNSTRLAPLLRDHVFPALARRATPEP